MGSTVVEAAGPSDTVNFRQLLNRRAAAAGIGHVRPHQLRRTMTHPCLANGQIQ
jgi:integrase